MGTRVFEAQDVPRALTVGRHTDATRRIKDGSKPTNSDVRQHFVPNDGIRASVDALCRDETGQISRDPRKNCLKTQRELLTRPLKLTKSHSRASIQLSTCPKASYVAPVLRKRIRSHAISRIRVIIIIIFFLFFSKPAISILERGDGLILSRSISRVGGGVHGHKAIVSFFFLVSRVDRGALHGRQ